jgi:hypothetical protein
MVKKNVLNMLGSEQTLDEAPRFWHIEDFFIHGNKRVQRPIALGIHSQVGIAPVLMRAVHVDPPTARA